MHSGRKLLLVPVFVIAQRCMNSWGEIRVSVLSEVYITHAPSTKPPDRFHPARHQAYSVYQQTIDHYDSLAAKPGSAVVVEGQPLLPLTRPVQLQSNLSTVLVVEPSPLVQDSLADGYLYAHCKASFLP